MGEVKVAVKLTNTADMALRRRNLIKPEEVRAVEANALIDTGAVSFVLPSLVAERLGLARPFKQVVRYADGRREEVDLTEPVLVELMGRHTVEEALVLGDEVIIGQTILEKTDLHVDCRERRLLPNPAHPDQPVLKI
ncbi:MAG: clan AA aspartic protease [Candidatus Handelsmanbacteria bacterium RIFCSPLOWO2_12_FULL_64_10]|uniref:Clan AA aspartic protease n=1 Tax=Handelsmanbacteria sp. (strain RIFCSPLOWO2_12_FULL_64_10) TaxID=1817868 RepID=A0A1F6C3A8_HANXR|nr:MAG: clan AA aspartic protease [Candidatus Handelsmanbacteria bacterium RIFCSPLOWO2_12_FULL_64_10]